MKLISMKDFVLEQSTMKFKDSGRWDEARWDNSLKYAKFLSQPLTLSMFVPTDLDGNVLEEPNLEAGFMPDEMDDIIFNYNNAESRVLFPCHIIGEENGNYDLELIDGNLWIDYQDGEFIIAGMPLINIESLCNSGTDIPLTETAKNMIKKEIFG